MHDTNFNYPNITILKTFNNGVHDGYDVTPNEGYLMYSHSTDIITMPSPITGKDIIQTHYCRFAWLPAKYNFDKFDYIAVPETECEVKQIV